MQMGKEFCHMPSYNLSLPLIIELKTLVWVLCTGMTKDMLDRQS